MFRFQNAGSLENPQGVAIEYFGHLYAGVDHGQGAEITKCQYLFDFEELSGLIQLDKDTDGFKEAHKAERSWFKQAVMSDAESPYRRSTHRRLTVLTHKEKKENSNKSPDISAIKSPKNRSKKGESKDRSKSNKSGQ